MPALDVKARLDRVLGWEGSVLNNVSAELRLRNDRWEMATAKGAFAEGKGFELRIRPTESGRDFQMTSEDAGAALRAFDIFENMVGGKLLLKAKLDAGDGIVGELKVNDFSLVEAPFLAKLLSVASLTGVFDLLQGKGLPLRRLVFPFTKRANILDISDARSYGPALGFTVEGQVDLDADTVELNGTLVPAYTLNSVLGKLPILGKILVDAKGGGVFAATYRASGPMDDPKIVVNPLAALAPGVLRRLLSLPGNGGAADGPPIDDVFKDSDR